jgi:transcriptional regulator with XRE-family HTH domain
MKYRTEALRLFRKQARLTVEVLAERAHLTGRQVRNLEGGSIPKADTLGRLADALDVSIEGFFRKGT